VFVDEGDDEVPDFPDLLNEEDVIRDIHINLREVLAELKDLNKEKATGPDGMPALVLKNCANQLAPPLLKIFRKSLSEGKVPSDWKMAQITPIFKKGSKKKPGNYRPVSLTSHVCKILERLLRRHIVNHLEENYLLSVHQHGFVCKKSCQTNLLETFEEWTRSLDNGDSLDVIYLDYRKAFDTVPHKRLIKKLSSYGIKDRPLAWLRDFLSGRRQQVAINNSKSSIGSVTSGVPQGSVLGPILFIIYVNELPSLIKSHMKMFADDAKMYRPIQDSHDTQMLQDDIDTLLDWSKDWLLKFNTEKCKTMHLGVNNPKTDYKVKDCNNIPKVLTVTETEKDLGIHVVNNLKPTFHCQKAANKAMSALKLLRNAFVKFNKKNFKLLYTTYVRPHLDYCWQAVGPFMVQDFTALEKVQRRATKLVPEVRSVPYEERLKRLDLWNMKDRALRGDLIETYKILTGKINVDPKQFFELHQDSVTRGHSLKLKKRRALYRPRLMFFANRVVTPWNDLPQDVVEAGSTNVFKSRLDKYMAAVADG